MKFIGLSFIDFDSRSRAFLLLLLRAFFLVFPIVFLLFFSPILFKSVKLLKNRCFELLTFKLKLFSSAAFHWLVLRSIVSVSGDEAVFLLILLVYFFDKQNGLQACLGLIVNWFFEYFHSIVQLLALLLNLGSNWWLKTFFEKI